ncbi:arrestin domain-containing protein 3-like isoform 2-T2 [Acanthopagrus schlegelii]
MFPIQDFKLTYKLLNKEKTFSEGDIVAGTVTFTLTRETKVKSLLVKVKGDANVHWTEGSGIRETDYKAHRRYLKVKQYLLAEKPEGTVLPHGAHRYNFSLKIPQGDMPSSFKGKHGKITYKLEAKMSRSWHLPSKLSEKLNFVSKSLSHRGQRCQTRSIDEKVGVFSKGQVKMFATVGRKVCSPGDTLSILAKIHNSSSQKMQPKFSLHQKIVYHAEGLTKSADYCLCTMTGATLTANSEKTVSCHMKIPVDAIHSLHNCDIISVDYYLKVYLDISFAFDQEMRFPLVIVPSHFATLPPGKALAAHPSGAVGGPSKSDFPPPAVAMGPHQAGAVGGSSKSNLPPPAVSMVPHQAGAVGGSSKSDFPSPAVAMGPYPAGAQSYSDIPPPAFPTGSYGAPTAPGAYGYPAPGPTQPGNTASGYNNQWPQQAPPYSFPATAFPPPSVQHQGPTLFLPDPPAYSSLYPSVPDTFGSNGSDKRPDPQKEHQ